MPELPEVETIRSQLSRVLTGKQIVGVEVLREKSFPSGAKALEGKRIEAVARRAKMIVFGFKDWDKVLVVHLKMTGQLIWRSSKASRLVDWVEKLPDKHTRVIIKLQDGSELFFNDLRIFGWMKLEAVSSWQAISDGLPPDVVDKGFDLRYFRQVVGKSRRAVKLVLLDQQKLGGVGNIYANEALFLAGIDPRRRGETLGGRETERLYGAVRKVIKQGIKYGGSTGGDDSYVNAAGVKGRYQEYFLVYDREGEKCKRCETKIKKLSFGGRGTYVCLKCQK